jgi:hypothetical protein
MAIELTVVERLPEWAQLRGPVHSPCRDAVQKAVDAYPAWLRVHSADKPELVRFYKAAIQHRARHRDRFAIEIVKQADSVYLRAQRRESGGAEAAAG